MRRNAGAAEGNPARAEGSSPSLEGEALGVPWSDANLRAYGRNPESEEQESAIAHWARIESLQNQVRPAPREYPKEIVREANEENTGEPFTFTERLFVYDDYQPDVQPHEVDAKTRALAELCLALMNSNEFVYIY